jgi:cytoskeletal protein CcmA (bactofilin family)
MRLALDERTATVTLHSYVGSNTTIKGNFECKENFLVEGAVEGNLSSKGLIVLGKDSLVKGEVSAKEAAVSGTVVGTVRCSERLEIFESAKIIGTVQAPVIKVAPGAQINARIIMSTKAGDVELLSQSSRNSYPSLVKATN